MYFRIAAGLLFLFPLFAAAKLSEKHFPVDEQMRHRVDFWKKVYTQIESHQGFLHDSADLRVIYETMTHSTDSRRARQREVNQRRREIRDTLRSIAAKGKADLSTEEKALLARLYDPPVERLWEMAKNIRYQRGLRDHYLEGLSRSYRYLDYIKEVIREAGLPEELAYLPHVESAFNYKAYSKVGAAGIWQFMRHTARQYDLIVNYLVDERRDPAAATVAAIRYLRDNHKRLGTWPLALTAYNHGVNSMLRAVRQVNSTDLSRIIEGYDGRHFGFASQNFYATFVATVEISQEPEKYFGSVRKEAPFQFSELALDRPYTLRQLAEATGISMNDLKEYNLSLRPVAFQGNRYLPKNLKLKVPRAETAVLEGYRAKLAMLKTPSRPEQMRPAGEHVVRRGQNLYYISRLYKVPVGDLIALNNIDNPGRIYPGLRIKIPQEGDLDALKKPVAVARAEAPTETASEATPAEPPRVVPSELISVSMAENGQSADAAPTLAEAQAEGSGEGADFALPEEESPAVAALAPPSAANTLSDASVRMPSHLAKLSEVLSAARPVACLWTPPAESKKAFLESEDTSRRVAMEFYNLDVTRVRPNVYAVVVEAEETLGHFAEWAGVVTQSIRRLNRLRFGAPIRLGQRLLVPLSDEKLDEFNAVRLEFHAAIEEDFFENFSLSGTDEYVVRRGDTIDRITEQFGVPYWLLRRAQTDPMGQLVAGQTIRIPKVEALGGNGVEELAEN